jgi:hypothetical protein
MEKYIENFDKYDKTLVYDFKIGTGGIGDCIKFFMYLLQICIENKIRLYYLLNNIPIEKYLKLKHAKMYIEKEKIENTVFVNNENDLLNLMPNVFNIILPYALYNVFPYNNFTVDNINMSCREVFYFSEEVVTNSFFLLPEQPAEYISIHLRLGDKFLETERHYIEAYFDIRNYNAHAIYETIEQNRDNSILFFCDNKSEKIKIKNKYNNIIITSAEVGHTSLLNTTDKQVLDAVTEFYLLTNSKKIIMASLSGFSMLASKFKNVPIEKIY